MSVFDRWQRDERKQLFVLKKGQRVTAITGVYITFAPGHLKLLQDMADVRLRKGAVLETYMPVDEDMGTVSPRRTVLDKLLVDAAIEEGAELREGITVKDLLRESP